MTVCRACQNIVEPLWMGRVLDIDVQYFECSTCRYVQTEEPYWLDRAYREVINDSDTGILARNATNAGLVAATLCVLRGLRGKVVDYAGGYGILVRLLRDLGIDALWSDPYCPNLLARGFAHDSERATLVTAFEAFEHFRQPETELQRMLEIGPNVLISTYLLPVPAPKHNEWWYYGREHGQHIGFFRIETLRMLADKNGKHLVTDGVCYHLFMDKKLDRIFWKLLIRFSRFFPLLVTRRLGSRTWSDHELVSEGILTTDEDRI